MNWIFNAYSTVYQTAMLQPQAELRHVAPAKTHVAAKPSRLLGLFGRRQG